MGMVGYLTTNFDIKPGQLQVISFSLLWQKAWA